MTKTMIVERGKRVVVCSFFIWWAVQSRAFVVVSAARAYCENGSALQREQKKNGGASVLVERVSGKTV